MSSHKLLVACLAALTQNATAQRYDAPWYNGSIEYFIADIGPGYPCHPLYESSKTWFEADTDIGVRNLLVGLAENGFNGIRLPIWPESDLVRGQDPYDSREVYTRDQCDDLSKNIVKVLRDNREVPEGSGMFQDDLWSYFNVYYSPAFDGKYLQESLSSELYQVEIKKYLMDSAYGANFVSPFSNNQSYLNNSYIPAGSAGMTDETTIYELEVFSRIWSDPDYLELYEFSQYIFDFNVVARDEAGEYIHRAPKIIGPDRGRVQHTTNVIKSFTGESQTRPKYLNYVDIVGTQSRLGDTSSQNQYWGDLVSAVDDGSVLNIWCTMCANEWGRLPNQRLEEVVENEINDFRLMSRFAGRNYWDERERTRPPMAPAAQVLNYRIQGYVVEAALPRFVDKEGAVNLEKDWAVNDRIVDSDGSPSTFEIQDQMINRNREEPLTGSRKSPYENRMDQKCKQFQDTEDIYLNGYETCQFSLTPEEFALSQEYTRDGERFISLYVNYPRNVIALIESCNFELDQCQTARFEAGVDLQMKDLDNLQNTFIFENTMSELETISIVYDQRIIVEVDDYELYLGAKELKAAISSALAILLLA